MHQRRWTQEWAAQLVSLTIKVHNAPPSSAGWVCEATVVARHDNCGGIHEVQRWVIGQLSKSAAQQGEGEQPHIDALSEGGEEVRRGGSRTVREESEAVETNKDGGGKHLEEEKIN